MIDPSRQTNRIVTTNRKITMTLGVGIGRYQKKDQKHNAESKVILGNNVTDTMPGARPIVENHSMTTAPIMIPEAE